MLTLLRCHSLFRFKKVPALLMYKDSAVQLFYPMREVVADGGADGGAANGTAAGTSAAGGGAAPGGAVRARVAELTEEQQRQGAEALQVRASLANMHALGGRHCKKSRFTCAVQARMVESTPELLQRMYGDYHGDPDLLLQLLGYVELTRPPWDRRPSHYAAPFTQLLPGPLGVEGVQEVQAAKLLEVRATARRLGVLARLVVTASRTCPRSGRGRVRRARRLSSWP